MQEMTIIQQFRNKTWRIETTSDTQT